MLPLRNKDYYGGDVDKLGVGAYGSVVSTTKGLARKDFKYEEDGLPHQAVISEIAVLANLKSPYLMRCHDICLSSQGISIVMDLATTDLRHCPSISNYNLKDLIRQVCLGLADLHNHGICHFDIKPHNILVRMKEDKINLYLTDFSLATYYVQARPPYQDKITTIYYRAPEILLGGNVSAKADVWSLGVVIAEMILFHHRGQYDYLLSCSDDQEALKCIFDLVGYPDSNHVLVKLPGWREVKENQGRVSLAERGLIPDELAFVTSILVLDPDQRPSIFEVLRHPWLESHHVLEEIPIRPILKKNSIKPINRWKESWPKRNINIIRLTQLSQIMQLSVTTLSAAVAYLDMMVVKDDHPEAYLLGALYISSCLYEKYTFTYHDLDSFGVSEISSKRLVSTIRHILKQVFLQVVSPPPSLFYYDYFRSDQGKLELANDILISAHYTKSFFQKPKSLAKDIIAIVNGYDNRTGHGDKSKLRQQLLELPDSCLSSSVKTHLSQTK